MISLSGGGGGYIIPAFSRNLLKMKIWQLPPFTNSSQFNTSQLYVRAVAAYLKIIEYRRHEREESTRWGLPLSLGGLGGLPGEKFEFLALLCAFLMVFYAFETRFQSWFFARKDIPWRVRKPNAKQNRFQIVTICFTFFFSIFLRRYVTYVPAGFGKVLLALILGCHGRIQRGDRGSRPPPPLKNHKKLGYLSNTGPDLLKNHKATKPAFNVGPLSVRQPLT